MSTTGWTIGWVIGSSGVPVAGGVGTGPLGAVVVVVVVVGRLGAVVLVVVVGAGDAPGFAGAGPVGVGAGGEAKSSWARLRASDRVAVTRSASVTS